MKKIIISIITLIAMQAVIYAGPLEGTWVNKDSTSKYSKVVIKATEADGTKLTLHYDKGILVDEKIRLLGDSVGEKKPNKYGFMEKEYKSKNVTYLVSRVKGDLQIKILEIFNEGKSHLQVTQVYKKQP